MNAIGYIRVSTDGQVGEDKFGLDAQRAQIEEYAKKNDISISKWVIDEGESGAKLRPKFDTMIYESEISNPPTEAIVVAKSDRVARDINIYYYYKMKLKMKNIKLVSVTEDFGQMGVLSTMLEAFTMCAAEMERDNITKRTSAGRRIKSSKGGYSGGRAPMGYKVINGQLVINPNEAPTVVRAFELKDQGLSLRAIGEKLNEEGYPTRGGKPFVISNVQSMINNRKTYEGYYRYGKNGEWVKGQHEAILKEETE